MYDTVATFNGIQTKSTEREASATNFHAHDHLSGGKPLLIEKAEPDRDSHMTDPSRVMCLMIDLHAYPIHLAEAKPAAHGCGYHDSRSGSSAMKVQYLNFHQRKKTFQQLYC